MSDNKKYYYLKLKDDFFDQDNMRIIETQPNGYIYSNILLKLYLRSLRGNGRLMMTDRIPYSPDKVEVLAKVIGHDLDHVKQAIKLACELDKMTIIDGCEMWINDIQDYIGHSSSEADRKRKYRRQLEDKSRTNVPKKSDKNPPEKEIEIKIKKKLYISFVSYFNEKIYSGKPSLINNKSKEIEKSREFFTKYKGTYKDLIKAANYYLDIPSWYNWDNDKSQKIDRSRLSIFHFFSVCEYVFKAMNKPKLEPEQRKCECGYKLTGTQGYCPECRRKEIKGERI